MDAEGPGMLLSSQVQTRSMELVLAPIASHVSQLIVLTELRGSTPFPNLMPTSLSLMEAVQNLANVAQKIVMETADEELQSDMPVAYTQALAAAQTVLEGASMLCEDPLSPDGQSQLITASQDVLEGTMKVLLVWDDAEIRKIIRTANWVLDRLGLVQAAKSMRGLVICFGGFSEALMLLLNLADKRQKELTDLERKERMLSALDRLKVAVPKFSLAMQNVVKNPQSTSAKESCDGISGEISSAIHDLVEAVRTVYPEEPVEETDNMASKIMEVQRQLAPDSRYLIGPDLERNINAVMENSMAVAHVSRDYYREAILGLSTEVLNLHKALDSHLTALYTNPESEEASQAFDQTAEQLCEKLCELDRWVAEAVVDQVTDAFVETSVPINHLVQAATATPTPSPASTSSPSTSQLSDQDSLKGLTKQVELFRRHSRRLSQVAAYAAQSSADSKRVQLIKELADEIDRLTPQVVKASLQVRKDPSNKPAREHLDSLRREWAGKVQQLTSAINDIIDPEDFMAVSEANIHKDMEKCRDAVRSGNWAELAGIVHGIAAKARRLLEVARTQVDLATDPGYKSTLGAAAKRLERATPKTIALANELISNPTSQDSHDQFVLSLRELLESIHAIQSLMQKGKPPEEPHTTGIPTTSTPLATVQERMTKRHVERVRAKPRFIGSLGTTQRAKHHRVLPKTPSKGTQTTSGRFDEHDISSPRVPPGRQDSTLSFGEGFSRSFSSGDAETQTPRRRTREQSSQADIHYPSVTFGSPPSSMISPSLSAGSWGTPPKPKARNLPKPDSPTEKTVQSYASPLQRLATAAKTGDTSHLPSQASALSARAIRLTGIAESAAGTLKKHDPKLMKVLTVEASEISKLTPRVIEQAEEVAKNPEGRKVEELQMTMHQWAGHVRQLIDATQKANLPWSKTAEGLVTAAKRGEDLKKEIHHVSTQTERMLDVATTTIKAAETEESIGTTDESEPSSDYELQEQVRHVKVTMSEIKKLAPQLLSAAEMAASQPEGTATMEHLNLLSQEWATKAKVLLKGVDDVTLGMGGAADTLLVSARSGDVGLLTEQTKAMKSLASSLQNIAQDAMEGCTDPERTDLVCVTAQNLEKLSTQLIECAQEVAEAQGEEGEEPTEIQQTTAENTELLRRDWASQVHLLMAHIDDLTAEVAAPLNRLVDLALQASRTTSLAKQHLLTKFEAKASFIREQLGVVNTLYNKATDGLTEGEQAVENAAAAITFLKKLTPHAVGAARSLATDPGSALLDHFNHLRRQWASKAQFLLANLKNITTVDVDKVLAAFEELIHLSKSAPDTPDGASSPIAKSYSAEVIDEQSTQYEGIEVKAPSTPKEKTFLPCSPEPRLRIKHSKPDVAEMVLRPPHRARRPTSMHLPLPSWVSGEGEGDTLSVSSQSIAVAAQSLQEVTDEFLEEGNPVITVAKKMSQQMFQMAEFTRGRGELQTKTDMILTAKAIAANGQKIVSFANLISEQSSDKRIKANLQYCAEMIPTLSTQLRIIASVKASTPDDASADVMLVKNAQNLMQAVIKTVQAAESACMKGLYPPEDSEQTEAADLAMNWKKKLYYQRTMEAITAPLGVRGLRKLNRISTPSLADYLKPKPTSPNGTGTVFERK